MAALLLPACHACLLPLPCTRRSICARFCTHDPLPGVFCNFISPVFYPQAALSALARRGKRGRSRPKNILGGKHHTWELSGHHWWAVGAGGHLAQTQSLAALQATSLAALPVYQSVRPTRVVVLTAALHKLHRLQRHGAGGQVVGLDALQRSAGWQAGREAGGHTRWMGLNWPRSTAEAPSPTRHPASVTGSHTL